MEECLQHALHRDPTDYTGWLALADWLEETGQPDRAELLRLRQQLLLPMEPLDREVKEKRLRDLICRNVLPPVLLRRLYLQSDVFIDFSLIPPGTFWMGSLEGEPYRHSNESPRHRVTISNPFYLAIFPITQRQWLALMDRNPSPFPHEAHPVDSVNWSECQSFCRRLAERMQRPCRLPYEAEWEYACRAGTTTSFYTGNGTKAMRKAGWCSFQGGSGSAGKTQPVGQYLPNSFGLFDMHGNVREWCQDDLRRYSTRAQIDPRGPERGNYRVVRGGSWYYAAEDCRSACRYNRPIDYHLDYYGFRVLLPWIPWTLEQEDLTHHTLGWPASTLPRQDVSE